MMFVDHNSMFKSMQGLNLTPLAIQLFAGHGIKFDETTQSSFAPKPPTLGGIQKNIQNDQKFNQSTIWSFCVCF